MHLAATQAVNQISTGSILKAYDQFISSIAFCILAYSGVESVRQTAGFVRSWKEIRKAYWFLALPFYSPRVGGLPPKNAPNQFWFPLSKMTLVHRILSMIKVIEYEMSDRQVGIPFGWPLSSWLDRLSIGVMVYNMMKLPKLFPLFDFDIHYFKRSVSLEAGATDRKGSS